MAGKKPIVIALSADYAGEAEALAQRLGLLWKGVAEGPGSADDAALRLGADGLVLCAAEGELRVDLTHMLPRLTQRNLATELLVKAAKVKGDRSQMFAVDATAGFGEDALLLAAAGFRVRLYERNPYIAELLADALRRAAEDPALGPIVARTELVCGDSIPALNGMTPAPDVILLDPMFPERTKSAAVRKKFQLLHHLEEPCADGEELLAAAMSAQPRRIVIKRPLKGEFLAGVKPSYSLSGKAVRVDVLISPFSTIRRK
jgi:SAM-dependent methyltransferases related to tRNA (uracil-5-)-methyltransferase